MTEDTVRVGPRAVCLVDGPMDDYDSFDRETVSPEVIRERKVLCVPGSHVLMLKRGSHPAQKILDRSR